jgi:hypothetical protein
MFAQATTAFDYRSFFRGLLGPLWWVFEVAYVLVMVLILAVFGAAAGCDRPCAVRLAGAGGHAAA